MDRTHYFTQQSRITIFFSSCFHLQNRFVLFGCKIYDTRFLQTITYFYGQEQEPCQLWKEDIKLKNLTITLRFYEHPPKERNLAWSEDLGGSLGVGGANSYHTLEQKLCSEAKLS